MRGPVTIPMYTFVMPGRILNPELHDASGASSRADWAEFLCRTKCLKLYYSFSKRIYVYLVCSSLPSPFGRSFPYLGFRSLASSLIDFESLIHDRFS